MADIKWKMKGSMTVEMSFIMPLVLVVLMISIWATFYYHDKNVLSGAAYETAVVGSTRMREKERPEEEELIRLCKELIGKKCIFFGRVSINVQIREEEILVLIEGNKGIFSLNVEQKSVITEPEKEIRDMQRMKEKTINGT